MAAFLSSSFLFFWKGPARIKNMSLDNRGLIEAAYQLLLGRDPDEEGMRIHLNANLTPEALARAFMRSPEFLAKQFATKTVSIYGLSFAVPAEETIYHDNYEPHVFKELIKRLHPGVTFLDIGANIGLFTVHAAKRGANVIAIEPRRDNAQFLLENARQNRVSVEFHPLGASSEAGYATLHLSENTNAGIRQLQEGLGTEIIATQRIDTIINNRRVDVVKIDIEGHEYKAMLGANKLLSIHRPVIITEYSPEFQQAGSGVNGSTYLDLLMNYGYRLSILNEHGPEASDPTEIDALWGKTREHLDLLLEPI